MLARLSRHRDYVFGVFLVLFTVVTSLFWIFKIFTFSRELLKSNQTLVVEVFTIKNWLLFHSNKLHLKYPNYCASCFELTCFWSLRLEQVLNLNIFVWWLLFSTKIAFWGFGRSLFQTFSTSGTFLFFEICWVGSR